MPSMASISNWNNTRLGDLLTIKHGWPFKTAFISENLTGKPIVVNIGNFKYTGGFRFDTTKVREYDGKYPREYELKPGDILLVMTCQTSEGEILGVPARVPDDDRVYLHNQRLGKVIVTCPGKVDPDFLYWLFLWSKFNRWLFNSSSGTKILHTAPKRIEGFEFDLPSLSEQYAIASILGSLDRKIELNQQMRNTLEAIAKATFKHWFTDFEFPNEEGKPYKSSGGGLVYSEELGKEIPKGWRVGELEEFIDLDKGLSYKGEFLSDKGTPLINLGTIAPGSGFIYEGLKHYTGKHKERQLVKAGDIVIANTDITQKREVLGSPAVVPPYLGSEKVLFTHHIFAVRIKSFLPVSFIYYLLQTKGYKDRVKGFATGTTVLALPRDTVLALPFAVPDKTVVERFNALFSLICQRTNTSNMQSRHLARIRDLILPRLMSGKIRVPVEVR